MPGGISGRRLAGWAGALLAGLALAGCQTPAQRLARPAVEQVRDGVTTQAEVLREFGPPKETIRGDGRTLLVYSRGRLGAPPHYAPMEASQLTVVSFLFGPDDRLLRKLYSHHEIQTTFGAGIITLGRDLSADAIDQIHPGRTTLEEAKRLLGEPTAEGLTLDGSLLVDWAFRDARFVGTGRFQLFRVYFNEANVVTATKVVDVP